MEMQDFEREVLQKLAKIEANQEKDAENCISYRGKVDQLEKNFAAIEASTKSAHHRIDEMIDTRKELKKDLTDAFKEQASSIYRTAMIVGGVASFFATIIMWTIK